MLKSEEEQEFQDMQDRMASDTHKAFRKYRNGGREYAAQPHKAIATCSCPNCVQVFPKPVVAAPVVPAAAPQVVLSNEQFKELMGSGSSNPDGESGGSSQETPQKRGPGRPPKNLAVESQPKENENVA